MSTCKPIMKKWWKGIIVTLKLQVKKSMHDIFCIVAHTQLIFKN